MKWNIAIQNSNYEVSDCGMIRKRSTGRICKGHFTKRGYRRYRLSQDNVYTNIYAHVIVATNFISNPLNKKEVNHKDRNPSNNHVNNLEWVTKIENVNHAYGKNRRKGISPRREGFVVSIKKDGCKIYLGDYKNKNKAYMVFYNNFFNIHGFYPWNSELN